MTTRDACPAMEGKRVVVVGGSSGIGRAIAALCLRLGAYVTIIARDPVQLANAKTLLVSAGEVEAASLDMTDTSAVADYFNDKSLQVIDHLVISASKAIHGPFATTPLDNVRNMFGSKFFGPYIVAQAALPKMTKGGSITLFSGVLSRRPGVNTSGLAAVNSAVEGFTRGLALELGPEIRVNCCSPGMVRTEAYAEMSDEQREAMYKSTGDSLPIGRVGTAEEVAEAVLMLMTNGYITGQILDIDGGHMIRQYGTR